MNIKSSYCTFLAYVIVFCFAFFLMTKRAFSQSSPQHFEVIKDTVSGEDIFVGFLNPNDFPTTPYNWHDTTKTKINRTELVDLINAKPDVSYIVFLGMWCSDSQDIVPEMLSVFKHTSASIIYVCVNRQKQITFPFCDFFNIQRVPTLVAFQKGKEIFRIIEYGKSGQWNKDLIKLLHKH